MKKLYLALASIVLLSAAFSPLKAQNVQLLYDTGRNCVTSTVEMFRPDTWGSTFLFVDVDYTPKASGAYWEIARELNFWQQSDLDWLSLHLEYNGGLNTDVGSFDNAWLAGVTYSGHSADFTKTWSLSALYKLIPGAKGATGECQAHNFQITGVWGISFADGWCDFSGFVDFWREVRPWQGTKYIFMAEPQLWVNLNKLDGWKDVNLSVGGEIEISNNFVDKGFRVMPALGLKWTF